MYLDSGDHQKALGPSGKTSSKDRFFLQHLKNQQDH